ncbi:hypothetical protein CspHIS471_0102280 [Cutaneotrichosporon sp. HIS471]|nr:hypothetical protein CspHIS471_0102280 [Cutaneotrichosporon sp. HIS471]
MDNHDPPEFTFNPFDFENDINQTNADQDDEMSLFRLVLDRSNQIIVNPGEELHIVRLVSDLTNAARVDDLANRLTTLNHTPAQVAPQPNQMAEMNSGPRFGDTLGWAYPNPENIWRDTTRFDTVLGPIGPNEPRNGSLFAARPNPYGPYPGNLNTTRNTWANAQQDRWQEEIVDLNGRDGPSARRRAMERNDELFARRYENHFSSIQAGEAAVVRSLEDRIRVLADEVSTMGTAGWHSRVQIEVLRRRVEAFHNSQLDRANVARNVVRQPFPAIPDSVGFGSANTRINPAAPARLDPTMPSFWGYRT